MKRNLFCLALLVAILAACGKQTGERPDVTLTPLPEPITVTTEATLAPLPEPLESTTEVVELLPEVTETEPIAATTEATLAPLPEPIEPTAEVAVRNTGRKTLQVYNSDYTVPAELGSKLYEIIGDYPQLRIGCYTISLKDGTCIGYNESMQIDTASTVKAPFALFVMKEIAKGNHSLDEVLEYTKDYYCEGSGNIRYAKYGTVYTVKELIELSISISDNIAYLMLQNHFGYEGYNKMVSELGCTEWLNGKVKWGRFSAEELAIIWNEIYNFSSTCEEGEYLLDLLVNAQFNFIKTGLADYTKVAHKSGFNERAYNDAAIVFGSSAKNTKNVTDDYILVIMTAPAKDTKNSVCLDKIAKAFGAIMRDLYAFQQDAK